MKVFITETDKQNAHRAAIANIAKFYNIPNWEYCDNESLLKQIDELKIPLHDGLLKYLEAYDNWFNFYMNIKGKELKDGNEHELNEQERKELSNLIQKRQESLDRLQKQFDQEQFEKFKKINGLQNIPGINLTD